LFFPLSSYINTPIRFLVPRYYDNFLAGY